MSSNTYYPYVPLRKYYFAYHDVNGIIFPFAYVEEDGLPVGGIPKYIKRWEISPEDFQLDLGILERIHPIPLPYRASPSVIPKPI